MSTSPATPAERPDAAHQRGPGMSDATVEALGKLSGALEVVEHARGLLFGFHRLTGTADLALGEAVQLLREAGHVEIGDDIERQIVGRNIISGRWSFQVVEDYDDEHYTDFRAAEKRARDELLGSRRHIHEVEMVEGPDTNHLSGQR